MFPEIESRATFTAPLFSPAGGSAISQDVTGTVSDNADVLRNQDTNPNDPGYVYCPLAVASLI